MTKRQAFPSKQRLKEFVAFMREEGIASLTIGDTSIQLSPETPSKAKPSGELQVDRLPVLTEEQQKQEEEKDLYWSAG